MTIVYHPHLGASVMVQQGTISGNTSGASTFRGTDVVWAGGNNVTLQVSGNTVSVNAAAGGTGAGAAISAGTNSRGSGTVIFQTGNGVTFGMNTVGVVTASHDGVRSVSAGTTFVPGPALRLSNETTAADGMYVRVTGLGTDGTIIIGNSSGFRRLSAGTSYVETTYLSLGNSNGVSFGLVGATVTASHNGLTTQPRLDQVLDPGADKVFNMGLSALQFQYAGGGSFSTNATRQGLFEIDVIGNLTGGADIVHIHQSIANPAIDLLHLEAAGTQVTLLHLVAAASIAGELNAPLKWTSGSVPMVLDTGLSNSVANLNANYLQGKASSNFAAANTLSRWDPCSYVTGSSFSSHPPATSYFQHLENDEPRAISYINVVKSFSAGVPAGTSSNTSQSFQWSYRHGITLFSRENYGAQSTNLTTCCSASWGCSATFRHSSSSAQSMDMRWQTDSTGGTAAYQTNSNGNGWSAFVQGPRMVRIPFVTTLPPGEYWIAHGHSTTVANTAGTATTVVVLSNLHIAPQLLNSNLMLMGIGATSSSVGHLWPGAQGVASAVTTNNTMAMSVISNLTVNQWYWNAGNI